MWTRTDTAVLRRDDTILLGLLENGQMRRCRTVDDMWSTGCSIPNGNACVFWIDRETIERSEEKTSDMMYRQTIIQCTCVLKFI